MRRSKNTSTQYAVLEVTPGLYQAAKREGKLYIGFVRCRVQDYIPVVRCYQCLGLGHVSADCQSTKSCSQCVEKHELSSCPRTKIECTNCITYNNKMSNRKFFTPSDPNHATTSSECPAYKRIIEIIKSKINYG